MKLKKFRKKLNLNKKTIADLNHNAMKEINGGIKYPRSFRISDCCPTSGLCTGSPYPCNIC